MRTKQKKEQKKELKTALFQINPVDFDFSTNKGKSITIRTLECIQRGVLVAFVDNMITLIANSNNNFPVVSQIDYSEIKSIILN